MSLKLKINILILVIASVLIALLSVFSWDTNQLEDINAKRKFGQILLTTSDKLALGKLVLQSDSTEKNTISSNLIDDIFVMQIAIKTNLKYEAHPEQQTNLRDIQIQLPAISLLLESIQARLETNEELTEDNLLSLNQLDRIASDIQNTVSDYNEYLNTEEARITETTTLYTNMLIGTMITLVLGITLLSIFNIFRPIRNLTDFAETITQGTYDQSVNIRSRDEFGQLGNTFNTLSARLNDLITNLEKRISERTFELEQRSAYLESSAEISRTATSILDTDTLIQQVVRLIKERFELYYVGLFLIDARNEWAVLQAGTGEAGQKMLASGHSLKIGEGMIGWSIANAESRIALDVGEDAVRFDNPNLPETRSEGALPLRSRGRVLGALTVQSNKEAAFDQAIITTLQTMADQVAVALDNAELFAKSEAALESERRAYGELSYEAWVALSQSQAIPGYISDAPGISHPVQGRQTLPPLQATDQTIQDDNLTAIIPIKSHGRILGGIKLGRLEGSDEWTQEQLALAQTVSEQMSVALESARLYQDTQRRAAREQLTSEITASMRETLDVETVLETAAREIGQALGLAALDVRLSVETDSRKAKTRETQS
ncbi:MAG: GAF domain-containing protein [Chloroflexota bacterium]|nr:GAF domain-containing protein [Chloroflexota bacterium]